MATITRYPFISHLRAGPNEHIIHYTRGRERRSGPGLAYWFRPLAAAIAQVPIEDRETTFIVTERTKDMQEVAVQCTLTYRIADPQKASQRFNFTLSLYTGAWVEKPLERLDNAWGLRARDPARSCIGGVTLTEALTRGPIEVRERVLTALRSDAEIAGMGLQLVDVVVDSISPAPDLQKALETTTREAIQQQADTAVFQRRAGAVEKERAIKENELATQIELARRQEELIRRQGANKLLEIKAAAESEKAKLEADLERQTLTAETYASSTRTKSSGDADAKRVMAEAEVKAEEMRLAAYKSLPQEVLNALVLKELAGKLPAIEHLTITPDIVTDAVQKLVSGRKGE